MIKYYHLYILLLLFYCLLSPLYAAPSTLILTDKTTFAELNFYADILEDSAGKLTVADVTSGNDLFHPLANKNPNQTFDMGFTQSAFWLRIRIINQSDQVTWYLNHWGGLSRQVQVYLQADDSSQSLKKLPLMKHSRAMKFNFYSPRGSAHTLYFRIQDKQTPLVLSPALISASYMTAWIMRIYPSYGFILGSLFLLALYNFIYFIYLRDKGFLALSCFILGFMLEMGNHAGLLSYYAFLSDYLRPIHSLFAFIAIASGLSLVYQWLNIPKNLPKWKIMFQYFFWMSICLSVLSSFFPYGVAVAGVWSIFSIFLSSIVVLLFYQKGLHLPFSMIAAVLVFLIGITPVILRGIGIIGDIGWLGDISFLALLVSLILLSLTQAEQVRQKSEQAERIAATNKSKEEFLTTMSHELRTPMNAVVGAANLLKLTSLSSDQQELVSRLNISSQHMLSLINNILDLARVSNNSLQMESIPFKLDTLLQQVRQLMLEEADKRHLQLILNNPFHPFKKQVVGDPTRLQQVLLNLLSNAIKFTQYGEVSLTITLQEVSEHSVKLLLEVRDNGIGISTKQQQKLFQPFSQADSSTARQYGGSGLGLAISHKLVQQMGSELKISSRLGKGSCFFFALIFPLQEIQSEANIVKTPLPISQTSFADLRILLVDDDEMNRFFGAKLFKAIGVQIETAGSGKQAILSIQNQPFDLVFMDVSMPDMDGYETTQRIRADDNFSDLPIIALTAHAIAGIRERCLAAGMDDYLTKPFDIQRLENMIWQWAGNSLLKQKGMNRLNNADV